VPLIPRRVLQHARMPVQHLYFIEEGLVSVLANADEQQGVEVWLIGREGVVGSPAVLGVGASPLKHLVQVGGSALRIGVADLGQAISDMPRLRTLLLNYLHVALLESLQSAACNLRHTFPQRLARWLLTAQDRNDRPDLPVTQALLARILGVRRATVSEAITSLEREGVLERVRGEVRICDRDRLEQLSCRCYRVIRQEQDRPLRTNAQRVPLLSIPAMCVLLAES
jgi:CRP-like cAMP-binding protein